jgi:hypothetical protein
MKDNVIKYKSLFHFSVFGGPILVQEGNNFIIIGIQNQDHRCHNST